MKKLFKEIFKYFLTVYIYQVNSRYKKINTRKTSTCFIKSSNEAKKNKKTKNYFKENFFKLKRFSKKSKFIGLFQKNEMVCSGWIFFGDWWMVEEVNKKIKLNNQYLLYDFFTEKKFRNKGYYKLLLRLIQNKFQKKRLLIYSLSYNHKSIRAIKNSGFKLFKKLKK